MNSEEKEQIKAQLKAEIAELERQVVYLKDDTKPVEPDKAVGRLSRLDEMNAKSVRDAALADAENKLSTLRYKLVTVGTPLWQG